MKGTFILLICCLLFISVSFSGCLDVKKESGTENLSTDVIYQTSTIGALLEGMYEGDVTVGDLKEHGDLGLGTFNGLDGEMVVLDGIVYQVKADGVAYMVNDSIKTPFAAVTMFESDINKALEQEMNNTQLNAYMETLMPSRNLMYTIKIEGNFSYMKTRSVPAQKKPYPRLADVTKNQTTFEFENVSGTIVGFWLPDYVEKVNVPGYHLHFLTADGSAGGHILECTIRSVNVSIDISDDFFMQLPATEEFLSGNFSEERTQELTQVEKGKN